MVLRSNLDTSDLGKTFQSDVSKFGLFKKPGQQSVDYGCLEDITQRNPVQKAKQCFQRSSDQTRLVRGVEDLRTESKDGGELCRHGILQVFGLGGCHLVLREIEDFFRQQPEDGHVILADSKTGMAGADDLVDEGWPVVWPLLLEDRYQNKIELV